MQKTAMVTGATRNIGYAIAERFALEGYDVILTSRSADSARQAAEKVRQAYPSVRTHGIAMNPGDMVSLRAAFAEVGALTGRLDAYVSNAANLAMGLNTFNTQPTEWDDVMNANARGTFFGCQEAAKLMARGGAICAISSVHALACNPNRIVYSASKGAINAMMRGMAIELAHRGIRVNTIVAGAIWTDRWEELSEQELAERRDRCPLGRESCPPDIANGAFFLCSDQSATITGTELTIDSGFRACLLRYDKDWYKNEAII